MSLNRRYIAALILAALAVSITILMPLFAHAGGWKATVAAHRAAAHDRMSKDSPRVKELPIGAHLNVEWEQDSSDGKWCEVKEPGDSYTLGYVRCAYLIKGHLTPRELRSVKIKAPEGSVTALLYRTSWCGYCRKAERFLREQGVNLIQYDIEKEPGRRAEMKKKGGSGIPFVDIEGIYIRGYSKGAMLRAIKRKSQPR